VPERHLQHASTFDFLPNLYETRIFALKVGIMLFSCRISYWLWLVSQQPYSSGWLKFLSLPAKQGYLKVKCTEVAGSTQEIACSPEGLIASGY
jgi:hypothetical protein